jgi:hypothetical protein
MNISRFSCRGLFRLTAAQPRLTPHKVTPLPGAHESVLILKRRHSMKAGIIFVLLLMVMLTMSCKWCHAESNMNSHPGASISLLPRSFVFDIGKVPQGAVSFTASIKNEGATTITIAHPSICFPADYKQGQTRRFTGSHGKSEILLQIRKPDSTDIILRDGYFHYFDPRNEPLITIPANGTGTFDVGWFFQNARGRWEQDDEAAKVFLLKGKYKIRILLRNIFPKAVLYDEITRKNEFTDVWTGEIESKEITIEVK